MAALPDSTAEKILCTRHVLKTVHAGVQQRVKDSSTASNRKASFWNAMYAENVAKCMSVLAVLQADMSQFPSVAAYLKNNSPTSAWSKGLEFPGDDDEKKKLEEDKAKFEGLCKIRDMVCGHFF
ncbi:hypothetical protein BV898_05796 [Hypsibius exemplaris]|uniref:Uncharacterized protein n=1 Tax=Hypsibius exemplaris TaxID=2072580 RepID=A0A1W0WYN4_HYPEX|nr:hypothetical protein BV898_05796 [Hypsibius exemplaris]